jgi:hypothetical protein
MKTAMEELIDSIRFTDKECYATMFDEGIFNKALEKEKQQSINLIKQTCMFMGASIIDIEISKMEFEDIYNNYYNQNK